MMQLQPLISAIVTQRERLPAERALLVGISGIDGSGKGFVAARVAKSLGRTAGVSALGYNVAVIGVDGWLHLPPIRFNEQNPAEHFYEHALRLDEMFERLIVPLQRERSVDLEIDFTEETATCYRKHGYHYRDVDIILLEGIFLFKPKHRHHFDLTVWIDCSFKTALARAVQRCQEGLPPEETVRAFETIYFPAQRIHLRRDYPRAAANLILPNDTDETAAPAGEKEPFVTSILLPKP